MLVLAGQEDALVGDEDVVEERRGLDHLPARPRAGARPRSCRVGAVRARDQRQARACRAGPRRRPRSRASSGPIARVGSTIISFVFDRDGGVGLGAAHDDAVVAALDDPQVGVGVRLLGGAERAVALEVGLRHADARGRCRGVLVEGLDPLGVAARPSRSRDREQGEQRVGADLLDQRHAASCRRASPPRSASLRGLQVLRRARHVEVAAVAVRRRPPARGGSPSSAISSRRRRARSRGESPGGP